MATITSSGAIFSSPQSEFVITEAFERIGSVGDLITSQQIQSAQRSMNLILSTWMNRGLNLFTVVQEMLYLENNKAQYALPIGTVDILEATLRTSIRQLNGVATASSGIAQNAFDNNPATACTQTSPNGTITYTWTQQQAITLVGIQSNQNIPYTLNLEYSNDAFVTTGVALVIPQQVYPYNKIVWFTIPVPTLGTSFRVRETGGATLDIQELYFNNMINDMVISRLSRAEYMNTPNKSQIGRPSCFYVDRQINPQLYIWEVPGVVPNVPLPPSPAIYNNLFYTRKQSIDDIGSMLNSAAIPQRFLDALCSELAYRLAVKFAPEKAELLQAIAASEFKVASEEDTERVPLRVYGGYIGGWTGV